LPSRSTGKERDAESGNDYFGARYYASSMGRFMSPDWSAKEEPVPYAKLDDPQTLNLYAYVRNNPLTNVDKDGHCAEAISCTLEFAGGGSFFGPVGTVVGAVVGAGVGIGITYFVGKAIVNHINQSNDSSEKGSTQQPASPEIHPSEVKGKTPTEIDKTSTDKGLLPKGPDPKAGKGSYVDPVTGEQRVLVHPDDGHAHVNNPAGQRLGPDGSVVPKKSPEAHIPLKKDTP